MDAPLRRELDDDVVKAENDCLFDVDDESWAGLLTPPWSPCDSSDALMDSCTAEDCESLTPVSAVASTTTRARCDSFLCSCTSCECSGAPQVDGPVLRDCMWSQTTGLPPPPTLVQSSDAAASTDGERKTPGGGGGGQCVPCCPAITPACTNHTDRCVDPKNVFPLCHAGLTTKSLCVPPSQRGVVLQSTLPVTPDSSVTKSPIYDPDSETSAYCSSFSGLSQTVVCKSTNLSSL